LWVEESLVFPDVSTAPLPNPDLDSGIKSDYLEARSILNKSPRGAAALLRLCVQKLCQQLGEPGENLNDDIGHLVKKGLPARAQLALDVVRVIGNNAVHPGQISLKDDRDVALALFGLVNSIADLMITQPTQLERLYARLPEGARQAIERRDSSEKRSS
jgi:hypothetical protein